MNIADNWSLPDMTSPAEIEIEAERIAVLPTQTARRNAVSNLVFEHSQHVAGLIEKRARAIYAERQR